MQVPSAHLKLLLLHPLPSSASLMAATCETPRRTRISGSPPKTGHRVLIPKVFPEACMPSRRSVRGRRGPAATAIAPSFSHRAPFNTAIVVSTVCPLFSLSFSLSTPTTTDLSKDSGAHFAVSRNAKRQNRVSKKQVSRTVAEQIVPGIFLWFSTWGARVFSSVQK